MTEYVFDAEPLLAFLYNEPGHERVADYLEAVGGAEASGAVAEVTASELLYKIARIEGDDGVATTRSLRIADRDVRSLTRVGLSLQRASWRLTGEVKAAGGLSLGDAHAVALAHEQEAALVVGGDGDFDSLPVDVDVDRFREHGV